MSVLMWRPETPILPPALVYCDFEDNQKKIYEEILESTRQESI